MAALLVVAAAVALVVWRPWAGTSLVTRDFITVPFEGQMPDDWQDFTTTGDTAYTLFGTHDWRGLLVDQDPDVLADAEKALTDDPESLIHVYIDRAYNVYTSDAKGLADQVQSQWPESTLVGQGTRQIDDREAFTASGVAPLGDGQVRVYAVTLQDDPRLFMLFICPNALYDEWRPTFYEIVDSVHYTG